MARKDRMEADTTDFVNSVLDEFPKPCVKDHDRLCGRVSTALARSTWAYRRGDAVDEIFANQVAPAVEAVTERCQDGIYIDPDTRRTTCGLEKGFLGKLPFHGE